MKDADYSYFLSEGDKVRIAFRKKHGKIEYFIVQYSALINNRWRSIMRFDTCHDYAHKHTLHLNHKQYVVNLTKKGDNLNEVFTESINYVKYNFRKIKENYLQN